MPERKEKMYLDETIYKPDNLNEKDRYVTDELERGRTEILGDDILDEYLDEKLKKLAGEKSLVKETRGLGLMRGLELTEAAGPYVTKALEKGLILMSAGTNVIRFVPPLVIEKKDIDEMAEILADVLS